MAIEDTSKPNNAGPDKAREGKEKIDLKILLADDTPETLKLTERVLKLKYSSVETVENGRLLMEQLLASGKNFDFLVTDYNMPEMTGLEALKQIRATKHLKDLPVIMLSGEFDYEDIQKEVEALGGVFLSRPVGFNNLYNAIEKLRPRKK